MYRQAWPLVLAVAAGALIGALGASTWSGSAPLAGSPAEILPGTSPEQSRPDLPGLPDSEQAAIESLARVLNAEINERRVLAEKLEQLEAELADLQQNLRVRVQEAFERDDGSREGESDATVEQTREERLMAAGITRRQLATIDRLQAEAQMAWIELDDRARREGWLDTPRYAQEVQELSSGMAAVRDALGDESFDRYLFASGRPNRMAVGSIVEGSPAERAGFQQGDVVISYAGEKIYSNQQLVDLRSAGLRGEPVTVEIRRDGESLQLTIPRGPMGLSMMPTRIDPADE